MNVHIYKDSRKQTISIVIDGKVVTTMTIGEWSKLIATPVMSFP